MRTTTVKKQMGKVIWIVNHYASHLEERHLNLAANFAKQGYETVVITSSFHHGIHSYLYEENYKAVDRGPGVHYVYLKSKPEYQSNGVKRIFNMNNFCRCYLRSQKRIAEEFGTPDYIIASSAPPFMWEIGYKTAKKYGSKFIVEFRDIWPLSLVEVQGTSPSHPVVKMFGAMEKRAYKRADAIVATMPYAYKHVCDDMGYPKEKFHWMPNGLNLEKADKGGAPLPKDLEEYLTSHWCCIYIGSIVKSESVDYIVDAWKKVKDQDICFAVIGDGNVAPRIDEMISEIGGDRIRHFGSISKEQIPMALAKAKCCLAAIPNHPIYRFGLSMNKLNDYLYSGKPVVFACNWDNVVKDADGFIVPFGDQQAMADAIEKVFKLSSEELEGIAERETKIIRAQYDYSVIAGRYLKMMEQL